MKSADVNEGPVDLILLGDVWSDSQPEYAVLTQRYGRIEVAALYSEAEPTLEDTIDLEMSAPRLFAPGL